MEQLTPNLMVDNVNQTIEFYQKVLGFEVVMTVPEQGEALWAMVKCGKIGLMFQEKKSLLEEYPLLQEGSGGGLTFYIKIRDVKVFYNKVKGQANIIAELHKTFYGADEFALMDPNGFVLAFAGDGEN